MINPQPTVIIFGRLAVRDHPGVRHHRPQPLPELYKHVVDTAPSVPQPVDRTSSTITIATHTVRRPVRRPRFRQRRPTPTPVPRHARRGIQMRIVRHEGLRNLEQTVSRVQQLQDPRHFVLAVAGKRFLKGREDVAVAHHQVRFVPVRQYARNFQQHAVGLAFNPRPVLCGPVASHIGGIEREGLSVSGKSFEGGLVRGHDRHVLFRTFLPRTTLALQLKGGDDQGGAFVLRQRVPNAGPGQRGVQIRGRPKVHVHVHNVGSGDGAKGEIAQDVDRIVGHRRRRGRQRLDGGELLRCTTQRDELGADFCDGLVGEYSDGHGMGWTPSLTVVLHHPQAILTQLRDQCIGYVVRGQIVTNGSIGEVGLKGNARKGVRFG